MDIRIRDLEFEYPDRTFRLEIPELHIASGTRTAFVGPSGSGKTTLLRLLAGIHLPRHGSLEVGSVKVSNLPDAARREFRITRIGFIFQDFRLLEYLNVEENIRLPFRLHPALQWERTTADQLQQLIEAVGIADKLKRPVDRLSHGEQQRVALCRALLPGPRLVLADEPTGNLDPKNKQRILEILCREARKQKATLVLVTHDLNLLTDFDQVIDFQRFHSSVP